MAWTAQDGSNHHSASRAKLHDERAPKAVAAPVKAMAKPGTAAGGGHPAPTETPIEEHVGTHGPATEVHHKHDKTSNKHHVTSHHGEGESAKHHSVHDSAEEAHDHMGKAMGVDTGNEDEHDDETPDDVNEGMDSGSGEKMTSIPGMA